MPTKRTFAEMVEEYKEEYTKGYIINGNTKVRVGMQMEEEKTRLDFEITRDASDFGGVLDVDNIPLDIEAMRHLRKILDLAVTRYDLSEAIRKDVKRGFE